MLLLLPLLLFLVVLSPSSLPSCNAHPTTATTVRASNILFLSIICPTAISAISRKSQVDKRSHHSSADAASNDDLQLQDSLQDSLHAEFHASFHLPTRRLVDSNDSDNAEKKTSRSRRPAPPDPYHADGELDCKWFWDNGFTNIVGCLMDVEFDTDSTDTTNSTDTNGTVTDLKPPSQDEEETGDDDGSRTEYPYVHATSSVALATRPNDLKLDTKWKLSRLATQVVTDLMDFRAPFRATLKWDSDNTPGGGGRQLFYGADNSIHGDGNQLGAQSADTSITSTPQEKQLIDQALLFLNEYSTGTITTTTVAATPSSGSRKQQPKAAHRRDRQLVDRQHDPLARLLHYATYLNPIKLEPNLPTSPPTSNTAAGSAIANGASTTTNNSSSSSVEMHAAEHEEEIAPPNVRTNDTVDNNITTSNHPTRATDFVPTSAPTFQSKNDNNFSTGATPSAMLNESNCPPSDPSVVYDPGTFPIDADNTGLHQESDKENGQHNGGYYWYRLDVTYQAYWLDGRLITNVNVLGNISHVCQHVLNDAITRGYYAEKLRQAYVLDSGDEGGRSDIPVDDRGSPGSNGDFPVLAVAEVGMETYPDEPSFDAPTSGDDDDQVLNREQPPPTYATPLDRSISAWTFRGWVGFGLLVATVFIAISLVLWAKTVLQRKGGQEICLTENSVRELYQVEWDVENDHGPSNAVQRRNGDDTEQHLCDAEDEAAPSSSRSQQQSDSISSEESLTSQQQEQQRHFQMCNKDDCHSSNDNSVSSDGGGSSVVHSAQNDEADGVACLRTLETTIMATPMILVETQIPTSATPPNPIEAAVMATIIPDHAAESIPCKAVDGGSGEMVIPLEARATTTTTTTTSNNDCGVDEGAIAADQESETALEIK